MNELPTPTESLATRIRQVQEATRGISEQYPRAYIRQCIEQDRFPDEMWKAMEWEVRSWCRRGGL